MKCQFLKKCSASRYLMLIMQLSWLTHTVVHRRYVCFLEAVPFALIVWPLACSQRKVLTVCLLHSPRFFLCMSLCPPACSSSATAVGGRVCSLLFMISVSVKTGLYRRILYIHTEFGAHIPDSNLIIKYRINLLKPTGYFTYHQVWHSKVLAGDYIALMCFAWLSEQTVTFVLYIIQR